MWPGYSPKQNNQVFRPRKKGKKKITVRARYRVFIEPHVSLIADDPDIARNYSFTRPDYLSFISLYTRCGCCFFYFFFFQSSYAVYVHRHENSGDAATRHAPDAGKRVAAVLLRILHLRDRRGPAVGGHTQAEVLPQGSAERQVSRVSQGEPSALYYYHAIYTYITIYNPFLLPFF